MEKIKVRDGWIIFQKGFLNENEGNELFAQLRNNLLWQQGNIVLFGKSYLIPRMESFHSLNGEKYAYSGKTLITQPFDEVLLQVKNRIDLISNYFYNSVLINLYRNGMDSNGWHSDNEKELGQNPIIASLSIGATRRFELLHNSKKERLKFDLANGDLIIMGGALQHHWKHQIPKQPKIYDPRINLTFRKIDTLHQF
jgi:alkylated DNA repair dioxygenase AlkB